MVKVISSLVLIFAVLLFPPAVLALVSQNALPGEAMYPIKRKLEEGVLLVANANPWSRAWFSVAYSHRRFSEANGLLAKGDKKAASITLGELVVQTQVAVEEIKQVQSTNKKQALTEKLFASLEEYGSDLNITKDELLQSSMTQEELVPTPNPSGAFQPSHAPSPTPSPSVETQEGFSEEDQELLETIDQVLKEIEEIKQDPELMKAVSQTRRDQKNKISKEDREERLRKLQRELDEINIDELEEDD